MVLCRWYVASAQRGGQQQMKGERVREGPDWSDCAAYIGQLREHHNVECTITIRRDGWEFGQGVGVSVSGTAPRLVGAGRVWTVKVVGGFPCNGHRTMEGLVYELLCQLDFRASKDLWEQRPLSLPDA